MGRLLGPLSRMGSGTGSAGKVVAQTGSLLYRRLVVGRLAYAEKAAKLQTDGLGSSRPPCSVRTRLRTRNQAMGAPGTVPAS